VSFELLAKAEAADQADVPDGMSLPGELARRKTRLAKLAEARAKIEARAKERFEREQAEYEARLATRKAKAEATGKKPSGKPPQPPVEGPLPTDQINLTEGGALKLLLSASPGSLHKSSAERIMLG
jgi:sRNA-binding protein